MKICFEIMRVLDVPNEEKVYLLEKKQIKPLKDDYENFNFDITNEKNWVQFLRQASVDGRKLPRKDKNDKFGIKVRYKVYGFGKLPNDKEKRGGIYQFFPGQDANGNNKPAKKYGKIGDV